MNGLFSHPAPDKYSDPLHFVLLHGLGRVMPSSAGRSHCAELLQRHHTYESFLRCFSVSPHCRLWHTAGLPAQGAHVPAAGLQPPGIVSCCKGPAVQSSQRTKKDRDLATAALWPSRRCLGPLPSSVSQNRLGLRSLQEDLGAIFTSWQHPWQWCWASRVQAQELVWLAGLHCSKTKTLAFVTELLISYVSHFQWFPHPAWSIYIQMPAWLCRWNHTKRNPRINLWSTPGIDTGDMQTRSCWSVE